MTAWEKTQAVLLMLLCAWATVALVRGRPNKIDVAAAALLAAGSLWWLFSSPAYEGPTVIALSHGHGLTCIDLGVPPALMLAAAVVAKALLRRRRRRAA